MGLSNYELVLLDNLIYLDEVERAIPQQDTIQEVINRLLYKDGNSTNGAGTGTIETDWKNHYLTTESANCMMNKEDWIQVLEAIKNDPILPTLTIHKVENDDVNGFRAIALTGDAIEENVIVFKGTTSAYEWIDNGIGGYSEASPNQKLQQLVESYVAEEDLSVLDRCSRCRAIA